MKMWIPDKYPDILWGSKHGSHYIVVLFHACLLLLHRIVYFAAAATVVPFPDSAYNAFAFWTSASRAKFQSRERKHSIVSKTEKEIDEGMDGWKFLWFNVGSCCCSRGRKIEEAACYCYVVLRLLLLHHKEGKAVWCLFPHWMAWPSRTFSSFFHSFYHSFPAFSKQKRRLPNNKNENLKWNNAPWLPIFTYEHTHKLSGIFSLILYEEMYRYIFPHIITLVPRPILLFFLLKWISWTEPMLSSISFL